MPALPFRTPPFRELIHNAAAMAPQLYELLCALPAPRSFRLRMDGDERAARVGLLAFYHFHELPIVGELLERRGLMAVREDREDLATDMLHRQLVVTVGGVELTFAGAAELVALGVAA